jgi:hypothetical protein
MIALDDLGQVALDLRKCGVDAAHDFLYSPHGCIEGLDVEDEFFPLWELRLEENVADLERADFAAIRNRRGPDWTVEGQWRARAVAK